MDFIDKDGCQEYIYSEEYLNLILKYNDRIGIYDYIEPDCINVLDNFILIAYKQNSQANFDNLYDYEYNSIPKCFGLMDESVLAETGVERVRNLAGLELTGRGTLIGFVDTGIDYTNPLFRKKDGATRIKAIWDQNMEALGTGNTVYGYGAEYTQEDINYALQNDNPYDVIPQKDENGHGTFLASICAANNDTENQFSGIAYNSEILVVKLKQAKNNLKDYYLINKQAVCYGEDDIMLGIKYLVEKALSLGKPLVICLGLGTNQGDHNGNIPLEWYIDSVCSIKGISVVGAGGNEYGYSLHFTNNSSYINSSNINNIEINVGENDRGFCMEIWGNSPSILNISIVSPSGERFNKIVPQINDRAIANFLFEGSKVSITNIAVEAASGDQLIFLRFENPASGIWAIEVSDDYISGFDAWLPIKEFLNGSTSFLTPDSNVTLCSPANGRSIITTSGYNHYNNAIYVNSSRGYTRKNRIKPDICAPAVEVYGAFAVNNANSEVLFTRKTGTSVSAAVTAGIISLILEWAIVKGNNPIIKNENIKQMLIRGSKKKYGIEYPNPIWGWGNIDVLGVFEAMRYGL